jgi:bifunctional DNA primase/polymerase-like protein
MRPNDQLGAAALAYANLGYRVLPLHHPISTDTTRGREMLCSCGDRACGAVGKHPLTAHGLYDATSDPAKLGRWWRRWPQASIGLVAGEVADVLDIDGPAGRAALRRFVAASDLVLEGPLVRTGGGWHIYMAPTGTGNRAGLLAHVDWRGRGGYMVAPPSRHANGHYYRWLRPLTAELPAAPAPLRSLLAPIRGHPAEPISTARFRPTAGRPYGRAALEQELSAVAHAPRGRRNHTLYQAGIRLYSLVAGGVLAHDEVEAGLLAAATTSRLLVEEPAQTRRTLTSAERTGRTHPRGVPALSQRGDPAPVRTSSRQARGHEDRERDG